MVLRIKELENEFPKEITRQKSIQPLGVALFFYRHFLSASNPFGIVEQSQQLYIMTNIASTIKSIRDIFRKDSGLRSDAQGIEQLGWMKFLKWLKYFF
jgi:hypothetical protein